ncbi:hypothetical protein [Komagataeibacter swingsii]|nr:hypothetical protein [Komagataeibacter swingsii]
MTETYDYDLVVIGSGPSGRRAGVQAAKLAHLIHGGDRDWAAGIA